MDYSGRVNAKQGGGGVADTHETNVHTRRRIKELLASQVLDLDNDPYVFRNHLGMLECRLCLTTHINESSYVAHLGGKKHSTNLERRRVLDEKNNKKADGPNAVGITSIKKRTWTKIGRPAYTVTKIRDPDTLQLGVLVKVEVPHITAQEPLFRIMSYYELLAKGQGALKSFVARLRDDDTPTDYQVLVVSAEPYENIAISIPNREIDKDKAAMSRGYWWHYDRDTKEYFIQLLFK